MFEGKFGVGREKNQEGQCGHQLQIKIKYMRIHVGHNTAAHVAALNDQLEVLRMLATYGFNFKAGE